MSTEAAFIAAMAADPGDDTVRLAFADWLDENGQSERAEFVRLQCSSSADTEAAHTRAEELERTHRAAWSEPFAPLAGEIGYQRGFPHYLKADFALLVEHQALLGLAPDWHLCPTREGHDCDEPDTELCARFVEGPFVERVHGLNLAWAGWLPDELEALLRPPLIGRLRELRFGDEERGLDVLERLAQEIDLRLETLGFGGDSYGGIRDAGCRLIAESELYASLTTLELQNNDLTEVGAEALAGSPHLTRLQQLDLSGCSNSSNQIGTEGARHLAGSATFRQLTSLDLACNWIGDEGVRALLASPHLCALSHLNLPTNNLSDAALIALAESDGLPALTWLNVSGFVRGPQITAVGVARLARSPRMEKLTGLKLGSQPIGDAGALALAESLNCRNLRELHIGECDIGGAAFARLLESPYLAGIREFETYGNRLTESEIADLRTRHGSRVR